MAQAKVNCISDHDIYCTNIFHHSKLKLWSTSQQLARSLINTHMF